MVNPVRCEETKSPHPHDSLQLACNKCDNVLPCGSFCTTAGKFKNRQGHNNTCRPCTRKPTEEHLPRWKRPPAACETCPTGTTYLCLGHDKAGRTTGCNQELPCNQFSKHKDRYEERNHHMPVCQKCCKNRTEANQEQAASAVALPDGFKRCAAIECEKEQPLPISEFGTNNHYDDGLHIVCSDCIHTRAVANEAERKRRASDQMRLCKQCNESRPADTFHGTKCHVCKAADTRYQNVGLREHRATDLPSLMAEKFRLMRHGALQNNVVFDITVENALILATGACFLCGDTPSKGISRNDTSKGFTDDNVLATCLTCSTAKKLTSLTSEAFIACATNVTLCHTSELTGDLNFDNLPPPQNAPTIFQYRQSAERRKIDWNLSLSAFDELINLQCRYCSAPPPSGIDRVDSDRGYDSNNVVPACRFCNGMKDAMSRETFMEMCRKVAIKHN